MKGNRGARALADGRIGVLGSDINGGFAQLDWEGVKIAGRFCRLQVLSLSCVQTDICWASIRQSANYQTKCCVLTAQTAFAAPPLG